MKMMKIVTICLSYFSGLMAIICLCAPWLAFYQGLYPQGAIILILGISFCFYTWLFRTYLEDM